MIPRIKLEANGRDLAPPPEEEGQPGTDGKKPAGLDQATSVADVGSPMLRPSSLSAPPPRKGAMGPPSSIKTKTLSPLSASSTSSASSSASSASSLSPSSLGVPAAKGVFPLPNSQQMSSGSATGNPRNKVALKKGYSLMDWIRLTKSGKDLAGTGGRIVPVTAEELAKHNKRDDLWMALFGQVYNVTPYLNYHPGGIEELMKGKGQDATKLFMETHSWVTYDVMLKACHIGPYIDGPGPTPAATGAPAPGGSPSASTSRSKSSASSVASPLPLPPMSPPSLPSRKVIPPIKARLQPPTHDFHQNGSKVTVSIYTRRAIFRENVIAEICGSGRRRFRCLLQFPAEDACFCLDYRLPGEAGLEKNSVRVSRSSGKVEITLTKKSDADKWSSLGEPQAESGRFGRRAEAGLAEQFRDWRLADRRTVTHDVDHLVLEPVDKDLHFFVPLGHHVQLKADVEEDMEIKRSYTPVLANLEPLLVDDGDKLHLLIKTYKDGTLTPWLRERKVGDVISVSDHVGSFDASRLDEMNRLILLAAGTGFTPMAKLAQAFLSVKIKSRQDVTLIFFNKTQKDIIWRDQLDKLEKQKGGRFRVHHVLSQEDDDWAGPRGRVSKELLEDLLPDPGAAGATPKTPRKSAASSASAEKTTRLICMCGPIPFMKKTKELLTERRFPEEEILMFQG